MPPVIKVIVEYCPCGHIEERWIPQGDKIAQTQHSQSCPYCQEEREHVNRLNAEYLADYGDDF